MYVEAVHFVLCRKAVGDRVELKHGTSFVLHDVATQTVIVRRNIKTRDLKLLYKILPERYITPRCCLHRSNTP